jgi:hypothetical protein
MIEYLLVWPANENKKTNNYFSFSMTKKISILFVFCIKLENTIENKNDLEIDIIKVFHRLCQSGVYI